jgi:transposase InsO family protein
MLGFEVAQSTVSIYIPRGRRPPSQSWKTFPFNHAHAIAAIDLCIVPTVTFERLFAFLIVGHGRRQLLWIEVTRHPTAEWLARQITEAFPWTSAPAYLVRDNDRAYGYVFTTRVSRMGIRHGPISPGSPWQNGIAERLIGTLRRECLDHIVVFGERHLRRVLCSYVAYYNRKGQHLSGRSIARSYPLKVRALYRVQRQTPSSLRISIAQLPYCSDRAPCAPRLPQGLQAVFLLRYSRLSARHRLRRALIMPR